MMHDVKLHHVLYIYWFELCIIVSCPGAWSRVFFEIRTGVVKKFPDNFDIFKYVHFTASSTHYFTIGKIKTSFPVIPCLYSAKHYYFNSIMKIWNSLPPFDLDGSMSTLKVFLVKLYWNSFNKCFITDSPYSWFRVCPCSSCASLPAVPNST